MDPGVLISKALSESLQEIVAAWESGAFGPNKQPRPNRDLGLRAPIVAVLLDDLSYPGKVDAAILAPFANSNIQKISILGVAAGGTFTLTFSGQTTIALPWNATAAQVETALGNLSNIGKKNIAVGLGQGNYTNRNDDTRTPHAEFPGLWIVKFINTFDGKTVPALTVNSSLTGGISMMIESATTWGDTGVVETVNAAIPVGDPTPMRAGAVTLSHFVPAVGFVVGSCEPRQFTGVYTY